MKIIQQEIVTALGLYCISENVICFSNAMFQVEMRVVVVEWQFEDTAVFVVGNDGCGIEIGVLTVSFNQT